MQESVPLEVGVDRLTSRRVEDSRAAFGALREMLQRPLALLANVYV
jgi:hypothetical protein